MKLSFTKMHGCGNDYIYLDAIHQRIENPGELSRRLSDRHFGIGGDGIVLICPSGIADAKMRMFNADGSEGKMCGNAIRCVGKYLYDKGLTDKTRLSIETLSGIKMLDLHVKGKTVESVRVDMGPHEMTPAKIPVLLPGDRVVDHPLVVGGSPWELTCVSMGNPHCVIFTENPEKLDLEKIGPCFEHHPLFPEGINTEFVEVTGPQSLTMRVWERGSGETWACGTGACACAAAAVEKALMKRHVPIEVTLRGGKLVITVTDSTVYMQGRAETVFEGIVELGGIE